MKFVVLREEQTFRRFELRRIFGPKREEFTVDGGPS
jgi:hypothetical protein